MVFSLYFGGLLHKSKKPARSKEEHLVLPAEVKDIPSSTPLDASAKEVLQEFSGKPLKDVTAGSLQASFHAKERDATKGSYTSSYPIVVVGASAGGIESFTELLTCLPSNTGMGFIFIQHLSPQHESILPAILSRVTKMEVVHGANDMMVMPDKVYVIPPNTNMGLIKGVLKLLPRIEPPGRHKPIDFILRCLADDQAHFAVGVILSGADGDGAEGLRSVRAQGGITLVQDPKTAKVDGMPKAAILAGGTDTVLSIPEIAQELERLSKHPYAFLRTAKDEVSADSFKKILQLLKNHTGVDFSKYKKGTISRRLRRRVVLHKASNITEYLGIVQKNREELDELYRELLINVTCFFRDPLVFETLAKQVFPRLLKKKNSSSSLRIWVPGCSTGEEVYSLAMILFETMDATSIHLPVQIFASDLSEAALQKAREGLYPESIQVDVSPERLRRFFVKAAGDGYRVSQSLRETCVFATHDVTRDPPFSRMDMISCRNLLIYLEPAFQQRVINLFSYALNPRGYLLLGTSETVGGSDAFDLVDKRSKIYVRKVLLSRGSFDVSLSPVIARLTPPKVTPKLKNETLDLNQMINDILLERFSPPSVLVNASAEILQFRGHTGAFLEPGPGDASLNLFKMAKKGLDTELRVLLKKAEKSEKPIRKNNLRISSDNQRTLFAVEIIPLNIQELSRYYLVLFDDKSSTAANRKPSRIQKSLNPDKRSEIQHLQEELVTTREYLQSIIRDQESSNEELQAANEEVLSSNEELQSTNEELETAKEELQSANEELTTVNDELSNRNNQLVQVNNDLSNLLASVNIPIIMVGNDLCIRRFTPMVERVLNIIPTDIGRPITDIKPNIEVPDLQKLITDAINTVRTVERDVQDRSGHWYSLRIRPYRTADNKVDGAVLILVDIGILRQKVPLPSEGPESCHVSLDSLKQAILILDSHFQIESFNDSFCRTFQVRGTDIQQKSFFEIFQGAWDIPVLKALMDEIVPNNSSICDFRIEKEFPHIGKKCFALSARRIEREAFVNILVLIDKVIE
jgi:two-component system CheB/CheR fusion protein